jgi:hypothetical protein
MLSLRVQSFTAYNLIRSVVMEEMVHMSNACNILSALGANPEIARLDHGFPSQGLPGGAEPDLHARLAKLSKPQLKAFMRVEMPAFLLPEQYGAETYPTISSLYEGIRAAVDSNADAVRAAVAQPGSANQVGDNIGVATIDATEDPLPQIHAAIEEILEQGEGSPSRTLHADPGSEGEESHYCKFAELYYGHRYAEPAGAVELTPETEPQFFTGYQIPFPDVVNTLAVPSDGYEAIIARDPNGSAVEASLAAFDKGYSAVLTDLDAVWNGPAASSWPELGTAVGAMMELRVLADFHITTQQVPADVIADLISLYPAEHADLATYTDLEQPVFYGPRFRNVNA